MAASSDSDAASRPPATAVVPLVQLLAGNSVTGPAVLFYLNTADASALRRLHPAVAGVVAGVPWCDIGTPVLDVVQWRAALPVAVSALVVRLPEQTRMWPAVAAALEGVTRLVLRKCGSLETAVVLANLASSLRVLAVHDPLSMMSARGFTHLTALVSLTCDELGDEVECLPASLHELRLGHCILPATADLRHLVSLRLLSCSGGSLSRTVVASLPPSLEELDIGRMRLPAGMSLAHLPRLRVVRREYSNTIDTESVACLPPCLLELALLGCWASPTFAHLHALLTLNIRGSGCGDASLASLPPSLVTLDVSWCKRLTPAAMLPHLPALTTLDASDTSIGDALVASLPVGLTSLTIVECPDLTCATTFDHLPALRELHSWGTDCSETSLAACRARGCTAPADGVFDVHDHDVTCLAVLPDGRLASGDEGGTVLVWDVAQRCEASVFTGGEIGEAWVLAALPDGRRLAVGCEASACLRLSTVRGVSIVTVSSDGDDTGATAAKCVLDAEVWSLAVLVDGRIATGCGDGNIWITGVDTPAAEVVVLAEHMDKVVALAVLADGRLASGSWDASVRVWDVGEWTCVVTLAGYKAPVTALAVLADGRLASGEGNGSVRLWDVSTATCVGVLAGHTRAVTALATLPDGRLASGSLDCTIRLWSVDRDITGSRLPASFAPSMVFGPQREAVIALVTLPDGRLASSDGEYVRLWQPPAAPPGTDGTAMWRCRYRRAPEP